MAAEFNEQKFLSKFPDVIIREYKRKRVGDYTQALVDWVVNDSNADYIIILHSDVFFYNSTAFECLLTPLIKDSTLVLSGWEVPFSEYSSTFHISENTKKNFFVAPRICTWLMAINSYSYKTIKIPKESLWLGNFHISNIQNEPFPKDINLKDFMSWFLECNIMDDMHKTCLLDIGTFAKYYVDKDLIRFFSLGNVPNPDFKTMELDYNSYGYVHIEQYDPERFNDLFYKSSLLELRSRKIKEIIDNIG